MSQIKRRDSHVKERKSKRCVADPVPDCRDCDACDSSKEVNKEKPKDGGETSRQSFLQSMGITKKFGKTKKGEHQKELKKMKTAKKVKKSRSASPKKSRSASPKERRSKSPKERRSKSPKETRSKSPKETRSKSPKETRSKSPKKSGSASPRKSTSKSPKRSEESPKKKKSKSEKPCSEEDMKDIEAYKREERRKARQPKMNVKYSPPAPKWQKRQPYPTLPYPEMVDLTRKGSKLVKTGDPKHKEGTPRRGVLGQERYYGPMACPPDCGKKGRPKVKRVTSTPDDDQKMSIVKRILYSIAKCMYGGWFLWQQRMFQVGSVLLMVSVGFLMLCIVEAIPCYGFRDIRPTTDWTEYEVHWDWYDWTTRAP